MRSFYTPVLRLAPEAWGVLLLLALIASVAYQRDLLPLVLVCLLLGLVVAVFCHDMPRHSAARPLGVLAPVDGVVSFRRECHDPYLGREAIRIGITVSPWGNYLLRVPVEGRVQAVSGGSRRVSHLRTDEGEDILVVVAKGTLLGAWPVWAPIGQRMGQGKLCGVRRFAKIIELYLPADSRVEVALGQTIRCGETVLATLLRRS